MASSAREGEDVDERVLVEDPHAADVAGDELELLREQVGEVPGVHAPVAADADEELGEVAAGGSPFAGSPRTPKRAGLLGASGRFGGRGDSGALRPNRPLWPRGGSDPVRNRRGRGRGRSVPRPPAAGGRAAAVLPRLTGRASCDFSSDAMNRGRRRSGTCRRIRVRSRASSALSSSRTLLSTRSIAPVRSASSSGKFFPVERHADSLLQPAEVLLPFTTARRCAARFSIPPGERTRAGREIQEHDHGWERGLPGQGPPRRRRAEPAGRPASAARAPGAVSRRSAC